MLMMMMMMKMLVLYLCGLYDECIISAVMVIKNVILIGVYLIYFTDGTSNPSFTVSPVRIRKGK